MRVRSALFLDFDNVLSALEKESPRAAKRFCDDPTGWLGALRRLELVDYVDPEVSSRALLFLRCYANPDLLQKRNSRAYFVRSGFSMVDCPPLTSNGKNSADIHIVLDAVGLLSHPTHFSEFIILSADADFTPLLVRLRENDRSSVIFSTQLTSGAYKAVATSLLSINRLVEYLDDRRIVPARKPEAQPVCVTNGNPLAQTMITAIQNAVRERGGAIAQAAAAQIARSACPEGNDQNWAGFGGFRKMLESFDGTGLVLDVENNLIVSESLPSAGVINPSLLEDPSISDETKDLVRRLRNILDCPLLSTDQFLSCYSVLIRRIQVENPDPNSIARDTRDELRDQGRPVSRQNIRYILDALMLSYPERGVPLSVEAMARAYRYSLSRACEAAGAPLSAAESEILGVWVGVGYDAG